MSATQCITSLPARDVSNGHIPHIQAFSGRCTKSRSYSCIIQHREVRQSAFICIVIRAGRKYPEVRTLAVVIMMVTATITGCGGIEGFC